MVSCVRVCCYLVLLGTTRALAVFRNNSIAHSHTVAVDRRVSVAKCIHGLLGNLLHILSRWPCACLINSHRVSTAISVRTERARANRHTRTLTLAPSANIIHTIHSCPISRSLSRNMRVPLSDMCVAVCLSTLT